MPSIAITEAAQAAPTAPTTTAAQAAAQAAPTAPTTTAAQAAAQVAPTAPTTTAGVDVQAALESVPMLAQEHVQMTVPATVETNVPIVVAKLAIMRVIPVATEGAERNVLVVQANVSVDALDNVRG